LAGDTVVALDGKTSRRLGGKSKTDASPLHLVSAFAAGMSVVLGQTATAEKSNEITAIPELLAKLAIEGCVVTVDAMGTQTKIAGSMPFPVEIDFSTNMTVAPVVAGDGRHQGALW